MNEAQNPVDNKANKTGDDRDITKERPLNCKFFSQHKKVIITSIFSFLFGGGGLVYILSIVYPTPNNPVLNVPYIQEGIDERDIPFWLEKLTKKEPNDRKKEVDDWYNQRLIKSNLRITLHWVIDRIDEEKKAKSEDIEVLRRAGRIELADKLEGLNKAIAKLRSANARGALRSAIFAAESMAYHDTRRRMVKLSFATIQSTCNFENYQQAYKCAEEKKYSIEKELEGINSVIKSLCRLYWNRVEECCGFDDDTINEQMLGISDEMAELEKIHNGYFIHRKILSEHIKLYKNDPKKVNVVKIVNDILQVNQGFDKSF